MNKSLDQHKTKVGDRRKRADQLLREAVFLDKTAIFSDSQKWSMLIKSAKKLYEEES